MVSCPTWSKNLGRTLLWMPRLHNGHDHFSARTRQQQMTYEQQCIHTSNWQCCIKAAACVSNKAKMQFSILVTLAPKCQDVIGGGDLLSSNCLIWWFVFMILQLPNGRKYKKNAKMNGLIIYSKFWYFFLLTKFFENKNKKKIPEFWLYYKPIHFGIFLTFSTIRELKNHENKSSNQTVRRQQIAATYIVQKAWIRLYN